MTVNPDDFDWSEIESEIEWRKCFPDTIRPIELFEGFKYFCSTYWQIRHPERGRIRFDLFDAQEEAVLSWLCNRYSLVLKARQIGFSTLVAAFAFWLAFGYNDRPILMLSRTEREAIKLLARVKYGYQGLPAWMKHRGPPVSSTLTKMEFSNGSYLESLPSASDPARGESAYLIIVDEFAFLPNMDDAWSAIEPVADVGGRVILLSTANGEGNLFHKLWAGAQAGTNRFEALFFPWSANGRDDDWYEAKVEDLPEWQMAQEYPDNAEDAFLKSGRPVFDLRMLREREAGVREPIASGMLDEQLTFEAGAGELLIWEWPAEDGKYAIGADASQGLEHGDYSSVHVINARNHHVVAHWHGHIDPDLLGSQIIYRLGLFYSQALVGVESNTHGLTTLKTLERLGYFPIYTERNSRYKSKGKRAKPTEQLGFHTTQISKPYIIDNLEEALRDGQMSLWHRETFAELKTYVYTGDKSNKMEGSPFDDRTMSLAIANHMLKFVFFSQYQPEALPGPGTIGYWERQLYGESFSQLIERKGSRRNSRKSRPKIGQFNVRQHNPV